MHLKECLNQMTRQPLAIAVVSYLYLKWVLMLNGGTHVPQMFPLTTTMMIIGLRSRLEATLDRPFDNERPH